MSDSIIVTDGEIYKVYEVKCPFCEKKHYFRAQDFFYSTEHSEMGAVVVCGVCLITFFVTRPNNKF